MLTEEPPNERRQHQGLKAEGETITAPDLPAHYKSSIDYFTHLRDGKEDWYRDDRLLKEEGYATHLITREAVRVIEDRGDFISLQHMQVR